MIKVIQYTLLLMTFLINSFSKNGIFLTITALICACVLLEPVTMYESAENRQFPSPGTLTVLLGTVKYVLELPGPYATGATNVRFSTSHHLL